MKSKLFFVALLLISLLLVLAGLSVGAFPTPPKVLFHAIFDYDAANSLHFVITEIRLPRLILTLLTGGALALAGYLLQTMVNNPLADPFILGTASGASLGVNFAYLGIIPLLGTSTTGASFFAFAGAMLVTLTAVAISYDKGRINPSRLLLAGIALSSLMVALTTFLLFVVNSESRLKKVIFWSMGSLEQASWEKIPFLAAVLLITTLVFTLLTKNLNILLLGESRAESLGVNIHIFRWMLVSFASLITAAAVAVAGPIGFVGLIVPHFARAVLGVHSKFIVLFTVFTGGIFLLACDILSRIVFPEASLPIGIVTSFLGIPFFVYLLTKRSYRFS